MAVDKPVDRVFAEAVDRIRVIVPQARLTPAMVIFCGGSNISRRSLVTAITGLSIYPSRDQAPIVRIDYQRNCSLGGITCNSAIVPGPGSTPEDGARLVDGWAHTTTTLENVGHVMEDAAAKIAEVRSSSTDAAGIMDELRITVASPSAPRLTIVVVASLGHLDKTYVQNDHAIIVPAISLAHGLSKQQRVLDTVRARDPQGCRSLAVLIHADAPGARANFDSCKDQIDFHILCNYINDWSHDAYEEAYFSLTGEGSGIWADIPREKRGMLTLRKRLGDMLGAATMDEAGQVLSMCELAIGGLEKRLLDMDNPLSTPSKRRHLTSTSARFNELMEAAVSGDYDGDVAFFDAPADGDDDGKKIDRRLSVAIDKHLSRFTEQIRGHGRNRTIIEDDDVTAKDDDTPLGPSQVRRQDYVAETAALAAKRQGWELTGLASRTAVLELFKQQSRPWKEIATAAVRDIIQLVRRVATDMVRHVQSEDSTPVLEQFVAERVEGLEQDLLDEVQRLLVLRCPERMLAKLTEPVKKKQAERKERQIKAVLRASFGARALSEAAYYHKGINYSTTVTYPLLMDLSARLEAIFCQDMETSAASVAVDYSEELYNVSAAGWRDERRWDMYAMC